MDPLSARALAFLLVGVFAAFEGLARWGYHPPTPMRDRLDAYHQERGERDLVILGTCLPEQTIQADVLERELGGVRVHNLATQASSSLNWYLVVRGHLPEDGVAGILVPYGRGELTTLMDPGESQVMDVARLADVPLIARLACPGTSCVLDMALRKLSHAYRHREKLAKQVWVSLGIERGREVAGAPTEPPPEVATVDPGRIPLELGWRPEESAPSEERTVQLLDALVAAAVARNLPIAFAPLPRNPAMPEPRAREEIEEERALVRHLVEAGATHLTLSEIAELGPEHFEDEAHLRPEGRRAVSLALARELRASWAR